MHPDASDRAWRLVAAAALAVPAVLILAGLTPMLRALAALVLAVLPGYLIAWPVLRPRLGFAGAFTVAGGMAIGMIVIAGLVLNLLPWGLQAASWLAYVVIMLGVAFVMDRRRLAWRPGIVAIPHEVVLGGIGATMLVVALIFARLFASAPAESFTQLWVTPSADAPGSAIVSIRSEEQAATGYRLEVRSNGTLLTAWPEIQLTTGQTWSGTVTAGAVRIEVQLFRLSDPPTVYRYVTVLLAATGQATPAPGT
jgi:hypothetical protein